MLLNFKGFLLLDPSYGLHIACHQVDLTLFVQAKNCTYCKISVIKL